MTKNKTSGASTREKTIVIRDRRKPNQYTTDNIVAREWLPILRTGDAFFFYSVYLSMANRETESSWGSLRTLARYLQCGVDLIVRGNKLLEICELIYIEPGNQFTSNEYYILDPPALTPELAARIHKRLDAIKAQDLGKNWQAWVKQVRKALTRHQSLSGIWAERRARRGGRPVKTARVENPARESQAPLSPPGVCGSQPQSACVTNTVAVSHTQDACETQSEQEQPRKITNKQKAREKSPSPLVLSNIQTQCRIIGVAWPVLSALLEKHPLEMVQKQLQWLPARNPRDPAALFVRSVQENWGPPQLFDAAGAREIWAGWQEKKTEVRPNTLAPMEHGDSGAGEGTPALTLPGSELDGGQVWREALHELEMQMTRATFDTWLRGSRVVGVEENALTVEVRDIYAAEWLQARLSTPIHRTVAGIVGRAIDIRFEAA